MNTTHDVEVHSRSLALLAVDSGHEVAGIARLLLDEDTRHASPASKAYAARLGIELEFLPLRTPKHNPMDRLWRLGRYTISASRQYEAIDQRVARFISYLSRMSNTETLRKAGLLFRRQSVIWALLESGA